MGRRLVYSIVLMTGAGLCWIGPIRPARGQEPVEQARIEFMDLANMDINEILKILSDTAEWNIIPSSEVKGQVFVYLKDIGVEEALRKITEVNDYRYVREGNTITVMTKEQYDLRVGPGTEQRIFKLSYARAAGVAQLLRTALSAEGRITPDVANNQLIIDDVSNRWAGIEELIASLDQEEETRVIALSHARARDMLPSLQSFIADPGALQIDERTNRLIATDTPYHLDRLEEIVRQLDLEDLTETRTYVLRFADAQEVADLLIEVLTGERSDRRGGGLPSRRRPGAEAPEPIAAVAPTTQSPRTTRDESRSTVAFSIARGEQGTVRAIDRGAPAPLRAPPLTPALPAEPGGTADLFGEARALGMQGTIAADPRTNTLIVTHTPATLERIDSIVESLDIELPLNVYRFEHSDLETLGIEAKLAELLPGPAEDFQIDPATRKVTFRAPPKRAEYILRLFKEWDEPIRQVFIEARILRVSLDKMRDLGISIRVDDRGRNDDLDTTLDLLFPPAIGASPSGLLQFGDLTADEYTVILRALESDGQAKLLSNPRVTVKDREEALFQVVVDQPFIEIVTDANSDITRESTRFIPVGVTLSVTPAISSTGLVHMQIRVEVSSLLGSSPDGVPIVDRSEAQTSLIVKDGHTLAMGGLIVEEKIKSANTIPWLGKIPLIKYLFGNRSIDNSQSELVLFVTPHISDTGSPETPPDQLELGPSRISLEKVD